MDNYTNSDRYPYIKTSKCALKKIQKKYCIKNIMCALNIDSQYPFTMSFTIFTTFSCKKQIHKEFTYYLQNAYVLSVLRKALKTNMIIISSKKSMCVTKAFLNR